MFTAGQYYWYSGPDFPPEKVKYIGGTLDSDVHRVLRGDGVVWFCYEYYLKDLQKKNAMILPTDAQERKQIPIVTGVLDYFPLAIAEIARCSLASNEQHNPGEPLYWNRTKSTDHIDCLGRHLIDRGKFDTDGQRHSAKLAWRALANLEIELEEAKKKGNV